MQSAIGQAWITLFYSAANFIAVLAGVIGVFYAYIFAIKLKQQMGRDTGQRGDMTGVFATFLVAAIGLGFAEFVYQANDSFYHGTGAVFGGAGNPITWRAEDAPSLSGLDPSIILTSVVLIGFNFLGGVAFFLAMLTTLRFDNQHPEHHGSVKDFFLYCLGGAVSTNIEAVFVGASSFFPFMSGASDLLKRASAHL